MVEKNSEHEIFFLKEKQNSFLLSENSIKIRKSSQNSGYGLRVLHKKRVGFSYCSAEQEIRNSLENARNISKYSPQTNFSFVHKKTYKNINISDKKIVYCDMLKLKEIIYQIKDGVEKYKAKPRIYLSTEEVSVSIENTNDLYSKYDKTSISLFTEAMIEDGYGFSSYSYTHLPKEFFEFGEKAGKMADDMKGATLAKSGKYNIVFSGDAFGGILDVLLPSFSGQWKRKKISKLTNELGKKMFNEKLSIYEDGLANASAVRPFDDEGTPSRSIPLIKNGVVKNFLYDRETAALAKEKSDGCCNRGNFSSQPAIGGSNILIENGDYTNFEEELGQFILVESLHGTHTANTTTGDFGVEVNVAFNLKNGVREPKKGFMISGNVFEMLKNIYAIEKKQEVFGNLIYPRIAFGNVSVIS